MISLHFVKYLFCIENCRFCHCYFLCVLLPFVPNDCKFKNRMQIFLLLIKINGE